ITLEVEYNPIGILLGNFSVVSIIRKKSLKYNFSLTIIVSNIYIFSLKRFDEVTKITRSVFLRYHLLLYLYIVFIFALSSIPSKSLPEVETKLPIDKVVHFFEYGIFGILLFRVVSRKRSILESAIIVIFISASLGAIDESYQSFTNRSADVKDWIIDWIGAIMGVTAFILYSKIRSPKSIRNFID
ncbi:MAG: VanZ family protein, partial [bacterium]